MSNPMLAAALAATASGSGWELTDDASSAAVVVSDTAPVRLASAPAGNATVLVCEPTPVAARIAMDALSNLLAASLVATDRPDDLASALSSLAEGRGSVPVRIMTLAAEMPELSERQLAILGAVVAGQSNAEIARGLYLSAASIKREMSALYSALIVLNRSVLVARATALGISPAPVLP